MRLAEILLRIGAALFAWLMLYAHALWLATLRVTSCTDGGDDLWRLLLVFVIVPLGAGWWVTSTTKLPEIHRLLRWGALPLAIFLILAVPPVWEAWVSNTLGGRPICEPEQGWHAWWAPIQTLYLGFAALNAWRAWRHQGVVPPPSQ